jgi:hypothetical protein
MSSRSVIQFVFAALIVSIIGAFAGWYFFVKHSIDTTQTSDAARNNGGETSFGGSAGSTFHNLEANGTTTAEIGKASPRLWHVTTSPVAGMGFKEDTGMLFIADRATGNILLANPDTSSLLRLTNTLFPKIYEAQFSRTGDVILRTSDESGSISTFAGVIASTTATTATSTPNVLSGGYLARDIVALALQPHEPTSKGLFFIAKNPAGGSVSTFSAWNGTSLKKALVSPLTQWRAQWLNSGAVILTQKSLDAVSGYSFTLSVAGALQPLITDMPGLVVLHHPSTNALLYSTSDGGTVSLYVRAPGKDDVRLPIQTTAEKCVWAPGDGLIAYCAVPSATPKNYLEMWYQGAYHTKDAFWKVDALAGSADRFFATDADVSLDAENLMMDSHGSSIAFQNGVDKSLWLLRVTQ